MQMIFVQIDSIICHPIIFIWHSNIELSKCVRYCAIQHGTCVIDPAKGLATMWTKKTKSRSHSVQKKQLNKCSRDTRAKTFIYIYKAFSVPSLNKKNNSHPQHTSESMIVLFLRCDMWSFPGGLTVQSSNQVAGKRTLESQLGKTFNGSDSFHVKSKRFQLPGAMSKIETCSICKYICHMVCISLQT